jgi:phosphatidylserine decarboxylase
MIVKDGIPFVLVTAVVAVSAGLFLHWGFYVAGGILVAFMLNFFRNPERRIPPGDGIVSPADGRIISIQDLKEQENEYRYFVSIFMNVFDVHVNRAPIAAVIAAYQYCEGRFRPASEDSAPLSNERNYIVLRQGDFQLKMSQVAGVLARRIVFWKHPGDAVEKGERIGLIRFGSRVDLWFPADVTLRVTVGQKVKAGESLLAVSTHGNDFN